MMRAVLLALVLAAPATAQVVTVPTSAGAGVDQTARDAAAAAQVAATNAANAASSAVKTVNGTTPNASGAVTLAIPTASTSTPPGVADSGSIGTMTSMYALANHTHASKARKIVATTAADGSLTWTYSTPFAAGTVPVCAAVAEVAAGVTDVVNVQIVGSPTATSATFLANRSQRTTTILNLVSVTLLQILPTPGATKIHAICLEP